MLPPRRKEFLAVLWARTLHYSLHFLSLCLSTTMVESSILIRTA